MLPRKSSTLSDATHRRRLVDFLSELNNADSTTSDNFWLNIFRKFNGTSLRDLSKSVFEAKTNGLLDRLGLTVQPRKYQIELFFTLLKDSSNYIVFLPTGAGKTLVSYLLMKYMLEQYSDKHVVFLAKSVALAGQQYASFLNLTQFPRDQTELFYGGKTSRGKSLRSYRVFFMTPVVYQHMLEAGELKIHHCSLLVFDEVHHARKEDPYAVLMRDHVIKELKCHRPRVLGMTASPGEGRSVLESIASIRSLCSTMTAELTTPTSSDSVAELKECTAHQEVIIDEYLPSDIDSHITESLLRFLRASVAILIELEDQAGMDQNQAVEVKLDGLWLDSDAMPSNSKHNDSQSSRQSIIQDIKLNWASFESRDENLVPDDLLLQFLTAIHHAIVITPAGANKLLLVGILKTWAVIEQVQDVGAELAKPDVLDLLTLVPDGTLRSSKSNAIYHYLVRWNDRKRELDKDMIQAYHGDAMRSHGKMEPLMKQLMSMEHNSRAIVFVLEIATAKKVTQYLQKNLPPRFGAECLVGKAEMTSSRQLSVASRFNAGEFNVLVATSVAEEGIDIKACDLVVRLDGTMTSKALIQSRGRARSHQSRFVLIVASEEKRHLEILMKKEKFMQAAVRDIVDPGCLAREGIDLNALFAEFVDSEESASADPTAFAILHQWFQQNHLFMPEFEYQDTMIPGPTRFTASFNFKGKLFKGVGEKKKDSKFRAAQAALDHLKTSQSQQSSSNPNRTIGSLVSSLQASRASSPSILSPSDTSTSSSSSSSLLGKLQRLQAVQKLKEISAARRETPLEADDSDLGSESSDEESIATLLGAVSLNSHSLHDRSRANQDHSSSYGALDDFLMAKTNHSTSSTSFASSSASSSSQLPIGTPLSSSSGTKQVSVPSKLIGRIGEHHLRSGDPVSTLQIICQQTYLPIPTYEDAGQNPLTALFLSQCNAFGLSTTGEGTNKKLAKHASASTMLHALFAATSLK